MSLSHRWPPSGASKLFHRRCDSGCPGGAFLCPHALPLPCRLCNGSVLLELAANVMYMRLDADTGRLGLLS